MDQLDRGLRQHVDQRQARRRTAGSFGTYGHDGSLRQLMWGQGPGWRSHQRSVEELVKAETRSGPSGAPPRRPRTSMGASGVLGFVLVLVLFVLAGDCADDPDRLESTPPPTATSGTELALPSPTVEAW